MSDRDRPADTREEFGPLIEAIAASGDRDAFASLFAYFAPRLKAFMMRSGAPADQAEELAQETMLTVWRKAAAYNPAAGGAAAWIFTIARNLRIDRLRRESRSAALVFDATDGPDEVEQPDDIISGGERAARVRRALADLPPEQKEVIELSFFAEEAHATIAAQLDLPLGTVKSRVRLAMTRLRKSLDELT